MLWARTLFTPADLTSFARLVCDWLHVLGAPDATWNPEIARIEYANGWLPIAPMYRQVFTMPRLSRVTWLQRRLMAHLELRRFPVPANFATARTHVLPVCRQRQFFRDAPAIPGNEISLRPGVNELVSAVLIQLPEAVTFVTERASTEWNVPMDRLWDYALDNLEHLSFELTTLNAICFLRGPNASSLMFHRSLGSLLKMQEPLVVIAPNQDALVVFQPSNTDGFDLVSSMVEEGLQSLKRLSATSMLKAGLELSEWEMPGDSEEARRLKALQAASRSE